jgi:putative DNA primase/helicase
MTQVKTENIPEALKPFPNWVLWRLEDRDGNKTKVPYQTNGRNAASNDSAIWTNYQSAVSALNNGGRYNGIGFVVSEGTPIGIDLDHCRCPAFPDIEIIAPWAMDIIKNVNSYTEASPSSKGIRIFTYCGKLPAHGRKKGLPEYGGGDKKRDPAFEIYESGHYLTITGNHIAETPTDIMHRPEAIAAVHKRIFSDKAIDKGKLEKHPSQSFTPDNRLKKALESKRGAEIQRLLDGDFSNYTSQSEADMALCSCLAFWLNGSPTLIDAAFRESGLYRDKWDEKHHSDGRTYGEGTIQKAISGCTSFYEDPQESTLDLAIQRLAALSPLQYDQVRKTEAKALGVRPGTLDAVVKNARQGSDNDNLPFIETDPWPEPIDPATLLTDIATTIRRFIVCNEEVSAAAALWVTMTWFIDVVNVAPLAVITSPEMSCGKTLLLSLLGRLSARTMTVSNISPAALFRTIEAWSPTLLIDEADSFMKDNEDMRGLLDSGHTRDSAYVIRLTGDNFTPTKFSTWGAKALAGIGHVADTLMDRAVVLELRRKLPDEKVERIRYAESDLFDNLRAKLARFAEDYSDEVRQGRPPLPNSLNDRAQDNWEPLLAIAMTAGDEWLQIGTTAALKLTGSESAAQTIGTDLLTAIQGIFVQNQVDRISTEDLINALCANDEEPWKTYNKGFPITSRQLANKLKTYGIHSKSLRIGDANAKGFEKDKLTDAFSRYIPITPSASVTTSQLKPVADLPAFPSVTQENDVTDINRRNHLILKTCDVVTDKSPQTGLLHAKERFEFPHVGNTEDLREVTI